MELTKEQKESKEFTIIEKHITSWRRTDKYKCPKCGKKLGMPDYKCEKCNIKLELKMQFGFIH